MPDFDARLKGLFGKKKESSGGSGLPGTRARPGAMESFAEGNNDFALAMYRRLRERPGNLFFSPLSIRTALGMTHAGAKGDTAAQMGQALCFPASDEAPHAAAGEIIRRLGASGGGQHEVAVANSLWGQEGAPLQPAFLDLVTRHYGAATFLVDFRRAAEAARGTINRWVEGETKQKIRDLIPTGGVNADTRLVLVNAVYFKGEWVLQFEKARTREEAFYLDGGGTVRTPLMRQQQQMFYLQAEGYQAVELLYRGGELSMLVLLPDRKDGLPDLDSTLSVEELRDCVARMDDRKVELFLPRFKTTWGTVDLTDRLAELGVSLAFTRGQADFSGINGHEPPHEESLYISAVYHKAFMEVNEEGTEAAAATAVAARAAGAARKSEPPIPIFRADHPFLFAIRDRRSGAILFLGRVVDPT